jgi:LPPG:FO 2-phospho-L-lactate transferase
MTPRDSPARSPHRGHVLALCGGVGGAKLALGLESILDAGELAIAVNTGDDFDFLGLRVSPDLDTVLYTLSGWSDMQRGWGRANETWNFMAALEQLGGESWFSLGDQDLALHVERTRRLRNGESLSSIMDSLAQRNGIKAKLMPMTDDEVRTVVHTTQGDLSFQHYFVKERCEPVVTGISFAGAPAATPSPALMQALTDPALATIVICPSNPFLSIDPILSIPGIRTALQQTSASVVVVSPIVGGQAIKGPTTKIMRELGLNTDSAAIAQHYAGIADGMVIDAGDAADADGIALPIHVTRTLMTCLDDKRDLALATLAFADSLSQTSDVAKPGVTAPNAKAPQTKDA